MCGIFGIVTNQEQLLGPILVEAGRKLTYRGYDSVGCATLNQNGSIDLRKDVGKFDSLGRLLSDVRVASSAPAGPPLASFQGERQPHLDPKVPVGANGNGSTTIAPAVIRGMTVRLQTIETRACVER
jgi:hypothetical protein